MGSIMGETNGNENGNGHKWKDWIMQGLFAMFILLSGWIYSTESTRHSQDQDAMKAWQAVMTAEQSRQNERIAVLEAQYTATLRQLEKIEGKIDQLMQRTK